MVTKTNKYNPIASTIGSSRYNPISNVSTVEPVTAFNNPKPYQTTAESPKSYPTTTPEVVTPQIPKSYQQGVMENGKIVMKTITPDYSASISAPDPNQKFLKKMPLRNPVVQMQEETIKPLIEKVSQIPAVQNTVKAIAERTSGTGIYSTIQSISPDKTFREAYDANKAFQAGDPSKFNQFLYQLGDSVPQTAIGVALTFVPYAGPSLATTYWTSLSASEQIEKYGKITNAGNIVIDVAMDRMLGKSIEALFKAPAKSLMATMAKNFTVEGGTEVSQDLLKMANSYRVAKTQAERDEIMRQAKEYFTSGQILMTAGVGGISGAAIGGGAYAMNKNVSSGQINPILNEAPIGNVPPPEGPDGPDGPAGPVVPAIATPIEPTIKNEPKSRFATPQDIITKIERDGAGLGYQLNSTEIKQLLTHLVSQGEESKSVNLWGKNIDRGTVYKSYGGGLDVVLGKVIDPRFGGETVLVAQIENGKITGAMRTHGSAISDKEIVSKLGDRGLLELSSGGEKTTATSKEAPSIQRPGYQQLLERLDLMVNNKTLHPEDADIVKNLFANTSDKFLSQLDVNDTAKLKTTPAYFNRRDKTIRMRRGMTEEWSSQYAPAEPAKRILHEFGHAGYYMLLTNEERIIVDKVYEETTKAGAKRIFEGGISGDVPGSAKYYAKNPQEFFAESFSSYVLENKVPAPQMKSLLQRVAGQFFDAMKRLVSRGNVPAVQKMAPLFEKVLNGDKSTPLSQFESPPSFKKDLQEMFNTFEKPVRPNANGIFVNPQKVPVTLPPPATYGTNRPIKKVTPTFSQATKAVPPADIFPKGTVQNGTINPPVENIPLDPIPEPPEKVLVTDNKTPMSQRVRMRDKWFRTPWRVFDRMGIRAQYNQVMRAYEAYLKELKPNIDKITAWSKQVPKESNERIFRFLDGEKIELSQEEARVAGEVKAWLSQWADRLGMKPDARISEYITHIFQIDKGGEIPEELGVLINKKVAGSVFDPFLLHREGAEGYIKDTWKALDAYTKRATRKVNMDPALAAMKEVEAKLTDVSQHNYIEKYISRLNMRPSESDIELDNDIKSMFGLTFGARPTSTITRFFRQMISRAKIGASAVSWAKNLTQVVNSFAELGTWYTVVGYKDLVQYGSKELEENGVLISQQIEDRTYSAIKKMAEKADNVLFFNMTASEYINRGAAYYGAKAKLLDGKVTKKEYREAFGEPMPENYTPSMEDAIVYGKFVSDKTQFKFGPLDTQLALGTDIMKMVTQFSSFGIKQQEFIWQMVGDREWKKLARYLFASMILFQFIGGAFGMKWDDSIKTFRFGYPPAIQFFIDLYKGGVAGEDKYGNKLDLGERAKAAGKTLFTNTFPGGASILRGIEGFKAVSQGHSDSSAGKFEYKIDQTPMNYLRGTLFGKGNLPQGQTYYDNKEKKSSGAKPAGSSSSRYNPL